MLELQKRANKLKALNARLKELTTGEVTTDVLSQRIFGLKILRIGFLVIKLDNH